MVVEAVGSLISGFGFCRSLMEVLTLYGYRDYQNRGIVPHYSMKLTIR
jgi:hypothetical protein